MSTGWVVFLVVLALGVGGLGGAVAVALYIGKGMRG